MVDVQPPGLVVGHHQRQALARDLSWRRARLDELSVGRKELEGAISLTLHPKPTLVKPLVVVTTLCRVRDYAA